MPHICRLITNRIDQSQEYNNVIIINIEMYIYIIIDILTKIINFEATRNLTYTVYITIEKVIII